jgi:RimJ/RimL family protein N-acetyltransferase
MTVTLRRAEPHDLDFLVELANDDEVEPFLAPVRARDREAIAAELERSLAEPEAFGRFVIEVDGERAGTLGFESWSAQSGIANLGGLALAPGFRGRGIADEAARGFQRLLLEELGFHRLQLECYGFNERAIRHAERSGFVREGVKRKAYWRHGEWHDGVMFGLLAEDLDPGR